MALVLVEHAPAIVAAMLANAHKNGPTAMLGGVQSRHLMGWIESEAFWL